MKGDLPFIKDHADTLKPVQKVAPVVSFVLYEAFQFEVAPSAGIFASNCPPITGMSMNRIAISLRKVLM
jgi:hypothetical protein